MSTSTFAPLVTWLSLQSCALPSDTSSTTLRECNATYFSVLAWQCVCETCHEPYQPAGGVTERFCHHIPHCVRMRQCASSECDAPFGWDCEQCEYLYHRGPEYICEPNSATPWKWHAPLLWVAGLFMPKRPQLAPPAGPRFLFASEAARAAAARASEAAQEAKAAARKAAVRAAEKAREGAERAREKAGAAREVAREKIEAAAERIEELKEYFETPPAKSVSKDSNLRP